MNLFRKTQFKYYRIIFRTAVSKYTQNDLELSRALPVITDIAQMQTVAGFNYSQWYNAQPKHQFKTEPSVVLYYVLRRGESSFQLVRKNISDNDIEIVPNICGTKQDIAVQINEFVNQFADDITEIEKPLPKMFENGRLTDWAFCQYFSDLNRCPSRADTESLAQNPRKQYTN